MIPATNSPITEGSFRRRESDGMVKIADIPTTNLTSGDKCERCSRKNSSGPVLATMQGMFFTLSIPE